ncbi:hypothetical protein CRG98_018529, partial [Punica granatum]
MMLRPQVHSSHTPCQTLAPAILTKQFIHGLNGRLVLPHHQKSLRTARNSRKAARLGYVPGNIRAIVTAGETATMTSTVKAVVTVTPPTGGALYEFGINRGLDDITDLMGKTLLLELVSSELDP